MQKLVKINKDKNVKISNQLYEYLNPEYTYIPIYKGYRITFNDSNNIYKEERVLETDKKIPIYSPVSGIIAGGCNKIKFNNKAVPCAVISNNYKEELNKKIPANRNYKNMSKEKFFETLLEMGTLDAEKEEELLINSFYNIEETKCLVIKCFDNEPYIENVSFILKDNRELIFDTVDALRNILQIKQAILLFKDNDTDNIIKFNNIIGSYPNITIKLIPDLYPLNNNELLKELVFHIKKDSKETIKFTSIQNILNIYNAIKRRRQTIEKYITISGDAIENPCVINVKIGTRIKELLQNIIKIKEKDVIYYANGPLSGYEIKKINDLIVTNDFNGLIINKKEDNNPDKCINCGKCYRICPMGIDPKNLNKEKCIRCGLCSYFCPSNINLHDKGEE